MLRSTRDDKLDLLAGVPLFRDLARRRLRQVARLLDVTDVEPGRVLTTEGERGREFFVVVSGEAVVRRGGAAIAAVHPGDVVGELSLVGDDRRSATVVARTPMRLLVGERRAFVPLLDADPGIRRVVLEAADRRQRQNAA